MSIIGRRIEFKETRLGPFGGESGDSWDDGLHKTINKIEISTKDYVDSIRFEYDDGARTHGKQTSNLSSMTLNSPEEFIISISGYIGKDNKYLRSISFQTSMRRLGPFGSEVGEFFSTPTYNGKIVGFFGRSGACIDAIGAYIMPNPTYVYPPSRFGPFGGNSGDAWDDGTYMTIRQVEIAVGNYVDSIRVQYDKGGHPVWSQKYGGDGGKKSLVVLKYPDEFLTSISGYVSKDSSYVRSLTFHTNLKKFGPYGHEDGEFFSTPKDNSIIVGFYGRSGWYLDAIGAYIYVPYPINTYRSKLSGLFGGQCGNFWDDGTYTAIRQIEIAVGSYIDSIRVQYDKDGRAVWSERHGGTGGVKSVVTLNYPIEYLVLVSGFASTHSGYIHSLTFQTNMRKMGPYGSELGNYFSISIDNSKIIGFYGRSGWYLDAIGAHFVPNPTYVYPHNLFGAYGGKGGSSWDDGTYTTIREIEIYAGDYIDSIQVQYDLSGHPVRAKKHGGQGGAKSLVKLKYPDEFLISVSGYVSKEYLPFVKSLTFQTNLRKFGPYGREGGEYFSTPNDNSRIVGFYGRSGRYIDALGVHTMPNPMDLYPPTLSGLFGGKNGDPWNDGTYTTIRQIEFAIGDYVDSIRVQYDKDGGPVWSQTHGGQGGVKYVVKLQHPHEFLVSVSGHIAKDSPYVCSLTFQTNLRKFGPYPSAYSPRYGESFSTSNNSKIVGFYGRSGWYIDAIGVYTVPVPLCSFSYPPASLRPFGGLGETTWENEGYSATRQLEIFGEDDINSIHVQYDEDGEGVWSDKHGGDGGEKTLITLNYPNELIIRIFGFIDKSGDYVRSLIIQMNMRKFGTFGLETINRSHHPRTQEKLLDSFEQVENS